MIFTALFLHGYPDCRSTTDGVVSPQSADHAHLGELVGKGVAQIGWSSVERLLPFWRVHGEFGITLIIESSFSNFGCFPRARPSFVIKFTAASIPFYATT